MVMAIEADGKSYRASSSARDRDRLRKEHLERLGWTFQRLWSTNWFRDPESELAKVRAAYDEAVTSIGVPSRTGAGPTQGARGDARSSSAQGSPDGRSRSAGDVPGGGSSSAQGAPRGAGPAQAGAGGAGPAQGAPRSGSSSTQGATGAGSSPAQVGPRHPSPAEPIPGRAVALRDENAPERLSEELPSVAAAPRQAVVLRADILPEHQPHDDRHPGGMNKRLIPMTTRLAGIVTAGELGTAGASPGQIQQLVRRGVLLRLGRGVYAPAAQAAAVARDERRGYALRVATFLALTRPGTVASHRSAAIIHGLDLLGWDPGGRSGDGVLSVTRPPGGVGSRTGRTVVLVHTAALPQGHVAVAGCVPLTSVARTVVDVARTSSFRGRRRG
jgi:hypothetical protein